MGYKTFHYATYSGRFTRLVQVESENFSPKVKKKLAKFHPIYTLSHIRVFLVSSSVTLLSMINDVIYHVGGEGNVCS